MADLYAEAHQLTNGHEVWVIDFPEGPLIIADDDLHGHVTMVPGAERGRAPADAHAALVAAGALPLDPEQLA